MTPFDLCQFDSYVSRGREGLFNLFIQGVPLMGKRKSVSERKKRKNEQEAPALPLTPMIDCMFLLLIFFMLACRFRSEEGKLQAHLPTTKGQRTDPQKEPFILDKVRVKLLWYSPNGRPRYTRPDGQLVLKVRGRVYDWAVDEEGNPQPDWNALHDYLVRKKQEFRPPASHPAMEMPIIIDARKHVPFYWIVRALDTAVAAEIKNIEFAAPEIPF
jgi:biopolymer transport protein ExbD